MENKKDGILSLKNILKNITIEKWLLIGGAGIVLILCSDSCSGKKASENDKNLTELNEDVDVGGVDTQEYVDELEDKLAELIGNIEGAGNVKVMITLKSTSTKEVLMEGSNSEKDLKETDSNGGSRDSHEVSKDEKVILSEEGSSVKTPFVLSEANPKVEGVAVIAQGGDSPIVKEKITGIIKALFGIEINKIAVGKMK